MAQKGRGIFMVYVDIDAQHARPRTLSGGRHANPVSSHSYRFLADPKIRLRRARILDRGSPHIPPVLRFVVREHIGDIVLRVETVELGGLDQGIDCRGAAAAGIGAGKQVILAANGDTAEGAFGRLSEDASARLRRCKRSLRDNPEATVRIR
jgi:hypothetical protein